MDYDNKWNHNDDFNEVKSILKFCLMVIIIAIIVIDCYYGLYTDGDKIDKIQYAQFLNIIYYHCYYHLLLLRDYRWW